MQGGESVLDRFDTLISTFEAHQARSRKLLKLEDRKPVALYDDMQGHLARARLELLTQLLTLMVDVEERVTELALERNQLRERSAKARETIQELELRELIGEATPEESETVHREHGELATQAEEELGKVADAITSCRAPLERGETLARDAGVLLEEEDDLVLE